MATCLEQTEKGQTDRQTGIQAEKYTTGLGSGTDRKRTDRQTDRQTGIQAEK